MHTYAPHHRLHGVRILVVEDTIMVADEIVNMLQQWGAEVVGPVGRVREAVHMVNHESFEAALLDVNLHDEPSHAVAEALIERDMPFMFMTGYGPEGLPSQFRTYPRLTKPFGMVEFGHAIDELLALVQKYARAGHE